MPAYKDKKTNTWYVKFNYKNWKGETKFTTKRGFSTKREATDYENEYKLHIAGSLDMTFKDFIEVCKTCKIKTIEIEKPSRMFDYFNSKYEHHKNTINDRPSIFGSYRWF